MSNPRAATNGITIDWAKYTETRIDRLEAQASALTETVRGLVRAVGALPEGAWAGVASTSFEPSRDEFIRALGNVLEAYEDNARDGDGGPQDALHARHVEDARELLKLVRP